LDAGDILIAMNNDRLTYENFRTRLHSHKIGETLQLTVMRGERLLNTELTPLEFEQTTFSLAESPEPTPAQMALRNRWLGTKEQK
jgi:predicted metalloprotease with PDZ domain